MFYTLYMWVGMNTYSLILILQIHKSLLLNHKRSITSIHIKKVWPYTYSLLLQYNMSDFQSQN